MPTFEKPPSTFSFTSHFLVFKTSINPGPGAYSTSTELHRNSHQIISKFQRTTTPGIIKPRILESPTKHDRVPFQSHRPGPAQYQNTSHKDIMSELSYRQSRLGKAALLSGFGNYPRQCKFDEIVRTPGPGNYAYPSAFGHYVSKTALHKMDSNETSTDSRKVSKSQTGFVRISMNDANSTKNQMSSR